MFEEREVPCLIVCTPFSCVIFPSPSPPSTIQNITETPSHPTIKISNDNEESQHDATAHDQLAEENQREEGEEGQDAGQSGTTTGQKTVAQLLKQVPMCVCEVSLC